VSFQFLGPDPTESQLSHILTELANGRAPRDIEKRNVDVKEEPGRRGPGGVVQATGLQNEPAAAYLTGELACLANTPGGARIAQEDAGGIDQVPPEVVKERYQRLVELQAQISWEENQKLVGREVELMVSEGEGKKDGEHRRLSGRAPDNRLVHFAVGDSEEPRPGDMVTVEVTYAAPHHLVADSGVRNLRRTRAGDAWDARQGKPVQVSKPDVLLGMPKIGVPQEQLAPAGGCCDA
jgi:hypothetical protein